MKFFILFFTIFMLIIPMRKDNFLSRLDTTYIKGILQILIILHHLSQNEHNLRFLNYFHKFGMYSVGIFFFLSVYGLSKQLKSNREKYLDSFLKKRFLKIFMAVFLFTIIALITRVLVLNETWTAFELIDVYKNGSSIIFNGWYLNSILIIYLLFYVSFKTTKNDKISYILFSTFIIAYIFILKQLGFGLWWYNSMSLLIFGVIFVNFEDKILKFLDRFYLILLPTSIFAFYMLDRFAYSFIERYNIPISYSILQNIMCINFCIMLILIFKKVKLKSKILEFLGNISFEMYMIHGLVMKVLDLHFKTDIFYVIILFTLTIIFSYILNHILKNLYKFCKI